MKTNCFVVVNPQAGGGTGRLRWPTISRMLKEAIGNFDFEETTGIGHARCLAHEAALDRYKLVIACGGDGTIHEVVNGLRDAGPSKEATLGIISVGTGGDLIKTLRIPKNLSDQVRIAAGRKKRPIDLGRVEFATVDGKRESRYFINIVSAGLGAEVVRRVSRSRSLFGKRLAYLSATLESYVRWTPQKVTVRTDHPGDGDAGWPEKPLVVVVANGRFFGGGMPIAPRADPWDGFFDLVAVGSISPLKAPLAVPLLYAGQLDRLPDVRSERVKRVTLTSEGPVGLDIDGEPIGSLPATFEILPKALEVKAL